MSPLLAQFIAESRDQLEMTSAGLLAIENNPEDLDKLNEIFRAVHTIKGSSGLFEIRPVTILVHAAEDLLDTLRSQELRLDRRMIDLLLDAFDQVNQWLDVLERTENLPDDFETTARTLSAPLRAFLGDRPRDETAPAVAAPTFTDLDWLGQLLEEDRAILYARLAGTGARLTLFRYTPEAQCFFSGEDPFHLVRQAPGLELLAIGSTEPWPPLTEMDAYQCLLRFEGVASGPFAELATLFRYVPDQIILLETPPEVLIVPTGRCEADADYAGFVAEARSLVDQEDWAGLRSIADTLLEHCEPEAWIASALRWLRRLLDQSAADVTLRPLLEAMCTQQGPDWLAILCANAEEAGRPTAAAFHAPTAPRALTAVEHKAFQHIIAEQSRILEMPVAPEAWTGRLLSICAVIGNSLRYAGHAQLLEELEELRETARETRDSGPLRGLLAQLAEAEEDDRAENTPVAATAQKTKPTEEPAGGDKQAIKTLKIDQHKVDRLMDLIGELVVAKNSLPYLAQRAERVYGNRDLAREIKEQYGVINRIAQDLQSAIMQVRMMPVGHVFQRFPRLVRDLSKKLDKKIQLIVTGEETEADKNIIEGLADPLIHILRNSIDHGVEPPEERLLLGKPEDGSIRVKAYQDNDSVAIEITDDGRGIDVAAVRDKAVRRGLVSAEQAEMMSDHDAIQLIFAPGLSTTEQVSDISGRGVGMDVVRTSIEKVGGTVTLSSQPGKGTDLRLTLPLSMAVTHVMAVELDSKPLGVPMDLVVETVRLPPSAIYSIKHREAFMLRDQLVPLARLRRLLNMSEPVASDAALAILVVRVHGENVGIVVDDFREGMEVILKPMEGVLGSLRQYAGTALLGDGSVMLVINLKELI